MGLLTRVTSLIKADAHGVVDSIEDRSLLLKQHLREAEAELLRKQARVEALGAEEKENRELSKRLTIDAKRMEDDVSLSLDEDKEDLARFAVKKLLGLKRRIEQLDRRAKELRDEREELTEQVERQEQELSELRLRAKSFIEKAHAAEGDFRFTEPVIENEEIELELLRRRQKRNGRGDS